MPLRSLFAASKSPFGATASGWARRASGLLGYTFAFLAVLVVLVVLCGAPAPALAWVDAEPHAVAPSMHSGARNTNIAFRRRITDSLVPASKEDNGESSSEATG